MLDGRAGAQRRPDYATASAGVVAQRRRMG